MFSIKQIIIMCTGATTIIGGGAVGAYCLLKSKAPESSQSTNSSSLKTSPPTSQEESTKETVPSVKPPAEQTPDPASPVGQLPETTPQQEHEDRPAS